MENKELFKLNFGEGITDMVSTDDGCEIFFDNKKVSLTTYHQQDCCESVYGDFSSLKYHIEKIKKEKYTDLLIKGVKDMGFLLCFSGGWSITEKVFIPCYNSQNGYYSDSLSLRITSDGVETGIDITEFKEDSHG